MLNLAISPLFLTYCTKEGNKNGANHTSHVYVIFSLHPLVITMSTVPFPFGFSLSFPIYPCTIVRDRLSTEANGFLFERLQTLFPGPPQQTDAHHLRVILDFPSISGKEMGQKSRQISTPIHTQKQIKKVG